MKVSLITIGDKNIIFYPDGTIKDVKRSEIVDVIKRENLEVVFDNLSLMHNGKLYIFSTTQEDGYKDLDEEVLSVIKESKNDFEIMKELGSEVKYYNVSKYGFTQNELENNVIKYENIKTKSR